MYGVTIIGGWKLGEVRRFYYLIVRKKMKHLMLICLLIDAIFIIKWISNNWTWISVIFCSLALYTQTFKS